LYLVDYHVHTIRCGHACGDDREYIEVAIAKGLKEIGFSDHVPRFYSPPNPNLPVTERGMDEVELEGYVESVLKYRSEYKEIKIKLGLEIDYVPGWEERIEEFAKKYPWDYLIGSVHFVPEWNYEYILREKEHGPEEIFPRYFALVAEAAESGLFDILGHIDLPKRAFRTLSPEVMQELYQQLSRRIGTSAVVELNSYGIRSSKLGNGEIYPNLELLKLCRHNNVKVTLGSDAHRPQDVGTDYDKVSEILEAAGYDQIVTFNGRKQELQSWKA
jgi:histidinol-phosphatase (PHP family)